MATAKTTRAEPSRSVQRLIGEGRARTAASRRKLDEANRRPKPAPKDHPTGDMEFLDEDTFNKIVDGAAARVKQQSSPEIHIHQHPSKPDTDPPESGAQSGFSVEGPMGWQLRARGRVAWAVVVLVALLVAGVLLGRVTAPHAPRAPVTDQK